MSDDYYKITKPDSTKYSGVKDETGYNAQDRDIDSYWEEKIANAEKQKGILEKGNVDGKNNAAIKDYDNQIEIAKKNQGNDHEDLDTSYGRTTRDKDATDDYEKQKVDDGYKDMTEDQQADYDAKNNPSAKNKESDGFDDQETEANRGREFSEAKDEEGDYHFESDDEKVPEEEETSTSGSSSDDESNNNDDNNDNDGP